jgi:hypothetical protein
LLIKLQEWFGDFISFYFLANRSYQDNHKEAVVGSAQNCLIVSNLALQKTFSVTSYVRPNAEWQKYLILR